MKKRIEKVVECIDDDNGVIYPYPKRCFKVVSEKEVLEFEGDDLLKPYFYQRSTHIPIRVGYDLTDYDIKVIATPKDKTYEEMSKEELIELLKSKE